jgi:glycosyltransferase involved in cell wall biosynthesis
VERFLSRFTNLFINVSQGEKEICLKHKIFKNSKSLVIYNAINHAVNIDPDKVQLRNKLNLPFKAFIIISVVRFNQQKNLKATLSIAEKLLTNPDILFLIVGDGEEKEEIENIVSKKNLTNILLLGFKNNIDEYLSASDLYLSTSLWEGLPYSLLEAAASSLPIVASDVTGNNEVVTNGENGYLFQLNNLDDAGDKILRIKNSKSEQKLLKDNSLKIFKEKFQLDVMINKVKEIYSNSTLNQKQFL